MTQQNYTSKYNWKVVKEVKGWENKNMRDNLHKVKIQEQETGKKNTQMFTPKQTDSSQWKKHIDQWIERLQKDYNPSLN